MEKENKDINKKLQLLVSAIAEPDEFGIFVNNLEMATHERLDYTDFNLPNELIERFKFWQNWYRESPREKLDSKAFKSYGLALAIDLKLFLGNEDYHVSFGQISPDNTEEEILIDKTGDFPSLKEITNYHEPD